MHEYQWEFIRFALDRNVLRFGEFTLKSGRQSPYFFNAGLFNTGSSLARLGRYYAQALIHNGPKDIDMIFGPASAAPPAAIPAERGYAPVPGTRFERKRLWPKVTIGGGSSEGAMPGAHVALTNGRHAWQVQAHVVPSVDALIGLAAAVACVYA